MDAEQVHLDGELLNDVPGMRRKYGAKTAAAIEAFRKRCTDMVSPIEYYEGVGAHDNEHPWAYLTCRAGARQVRRRSHRQALPQGDGALGSRDRKPHNTNGLNALKNFVMDVDGYIGLYSIQNGNEQLVECLRSDVDGRHPAQSPRAHQQTPRSRRYQLNMMNAGRDRRHQISICGALMCFPRFLAHHPCAADHKTAQSR